MVSRVALVLILSGLSFGPFAVAQDSRAPSPPTEKEIALGRALAAELEAGAGLLDDAVVVEFVESMAQKLAESSSTKTFLHVRVLDSPEAVAHSLPGGFLLVRSGLITGAETTAELAGVLAHQVAHVAAGHGKQHVSQPPADKVAGNVPILYLGGWMGICTRVSGGAVPLAWLGRTRGQEEQADLLALEYLERAGYDPNGLVDVYDRTWAEGIPETARMTSAVRDSAQQYSQKERSYMTTSSSFEEIRQRLPKPSPQQAVGDAPSLRRRAER